MKKLLAGVSAIAMATCSAALAQQPIVVPLTGQTPPATPAGQQQLINGTPWINGRGAVQGVNWRDGYQIVNNILRGMGTWDANGAYTPSFGGKAPAASATVDATNASNILSGSLDATKVPINIVVSPGNAYRSLNDYLRDHISVISYGAKCDGGTNDYMALATAFDLSKNGGAYHIELPAPNTCTFDPAPFNASTLTVNLPYGSIDGSDQFGSQLAYNGPSTTRDLITVGNGTATSGTTSIGNTQLKNFTIGSATKMTAGAGLHVENTQFISMENVNFTRPFSSNVLWNALYVEQSDTTRLHNFFASAQNDCIAIAGNGAEPGANPANGGATGPQYDFWGDMGRLGGCHIGVHVGGGWDGAYLDKMQVTAVDYDAVVDHTIKPHPNQEVVFGPMFFADFARVDNFLIDDSFCNTTIMCETVIAGPTLHAGRGDTAIASTYVEGGSFAGKPFPTNGGSSVHVKSYPGGNLSFRPLYTIDYTNAAAYIEDPLVNLYFPRGTHAGNSGTAGTPSAKYGVYSTTPGFTPKETPTSFSFLTTASFFNVITPDVSSPYGGLKIGLGAATNLFAPVVFSNGGAEGLEFAPSFVAGVARSLYINRAAGANNARIADTQDALYHQWLVGAGAQGAVLDTMHMGVNVPIDLPKVGVVPAAPGAAAGRLFWVAGTTAGTCKLQAIAGTSATPVTIVDNVGGGC